MEYFASLFVFTLVAGITPGPNNMMLLASGLNYGIKKSIPHYLGICIGFPVMVAAVGFGIDIIFNKYPSVYLYLKAVGIVYLLYLAWKISNSGNLKASPNIRKPFTFLQAAVFQWLNPKAWIIAVGALAAFSNKEHFTTSVLTVIFAYFVTGSLAMAFWLTLGRSLQSLLHTELRVKYFNITMAALLALSVIPIVFTTPIL